MFDTQMIREHGRRPGRRGGEVVGGNREGALPVGTQVVQLICNNTINKTNKKQVREKRGYREHFQGGLQVVQLLCNKQTNKWEWGVVPFFYHLDNSVGCRDVPNHVIKNGQRLHL